MTKKQPIVASGNSMMIDIVSIDKDTTYLIELLGHTFGVKFLKGSIIEIGLLHCENKNFDKEGKEL